MAWFVPVEPGPPLGSPAGASGTLPAGPPVPTFNGVLPPGAAIVLYTDGLIEHRDRHLGEGMAALLEVAAAAPTTEAEALADHVVAALTTDDRSDDVAVMVVRRPPVHAAEKPTS